MNETNNILEAKITMILFCSVRKNVIDNKITRSDFDVVQCCVCFVRFCVLLFVFVLLLLFLFCRCCFFSFYRIIYFVKTSK